MPYWSEKARVRLNGRQVEGGNADGYCEINRRWSEGDSLQLDLDLRPHYWPRRTPGSPRAANSNVRLASVYRGPVLLAYDSHHQAADRAALPVLDGTALKLRRVTDRRWLEPGLLFETRAVDGSKVRLCDFASAGTAGTAYETWLPVKGVPTPAPFSRKNPLRSRRMKTSGAGRSAAQRRGRPGG
jgi:hypothetical protein